jgi:hypothetical protein
MAKNIEKEAWEEIQKEQIKQAYYLKKGREQQNRIAAIIAIILFIATIIMLITGEL